LAVRAKTNKRWIDRPGKAADHSAGLSEAPRRPNNRRVPSLPHCMTSWRRTWLTFIYLPVFYIHMAAVTALGG